MCRMEMRVDSFMTAVLPLACFSMHMLKQHVRRECA